MEESLYNVGSEVEISIKKLAQLIQKITEHEGEIIWDQNKPDGTPRKLMDSSKLHRLGWNSRINLDYGVEKVYKSQF